MLSQVCNSQQWYIHLNYNTSPFAGPRLDKFTDHLMELEYCHLWLKQHSLTISTLAHEAQSRQNQSFNSKICVCWEWNNTCENRASELDIWQQKYILGIDKPLMIYFNQHGCPCNLSSEHAAELGNPVPKKPILFLKPTTAYVTTGDTVKVLDQSHTIPLLWKDLQNM